MCVQGNVCVYKISDDDDEAMSSSGDVNQLTIKEEDAADETRADDDKNDENEINKKLKLSDGLPSYYAMEVKVIVYIIRVRLQYVFASFRSIWVNFLPRVSTMRDVVIAILSVRLSVCRVPVLYVKCKRLNIIIIIVVSAHGSLIIPVFPIAKF